MPLQWRKQYQFCRVWSKVSKSDARNVAGKGGGETERETDRQRQRHTDRQTDRQKQREIETVRQRDKERVPRKRQQQQNQLTSPKIFSNATRHLSISVCTSGQRSVSFTKYWACVAKVSTTSIANLFLFFSAKERSNMAAL